MKSAFYTRLLCRSALLIAAEIVLNRFCSINTMGLKIGVAFLPMALCGALYGPWVGAACYAAADLIGAMLFPTGPYFPGFTFSVAMIGAVFGFTLRGAPDRWETGRERLSAAVRIAAAAVADCGIGLFLNTLWIDMLYGGGYKYWFISRIPQYAIILPACLVLLPAVVKLAGRLRAGEG